jgi:hypothetical protein
VSEITTRIEQYRDGELGWPDLRDWLAHHTYVTPDRYVDGDAVTNAVNQADWDNIDVDGSWDEVRLAWARGDLTSEQFAEVSGAIHDLPGRV